MGELEGRNWDRFDQNTLYYMCDERREKHNK